MVISEGVEEDEEKESDQSHMVMNTNYSIGSVIYHNCKPQFIMSRSSIAPATTKPRHSEQELKNMNCSEEKAEAAAAGVHAEDDSAVKRGEQQSDTVTAVVGTCNNVLEVGSGKRDELGDDFKNTEKTKSFEASDDNSSTMVDVMKEEKLIENVERNIPTDDAVKKGEQSDTDTAFQLSHQLRTESKGRLLTFCQPCPQWSQQSSVS